MSYFLIEFIAAFGYLLAASDVRTIFENRKTALGFWLLALG